MADKLSGAVNKLARDSVASSSNDSPGPARRSSQIDVSQLDLLTLKNMSEEVSEAIQESYLEWRAEGNPKPVTSLRMFVARVMVVLRFSKRFQMAAKSREESRYNALLTAPSMRTPAQLGLVEELLLRLRFFQNMTNGVQACKNLANAVENVEISVGDAVFHEGDVGDAFFVVLRGSVAVTRMEEGISVGDQLWNQARVGTKDDGEGKFVEAAKVALENAAGKNVKRQSVLLAKLRAGDSFGDIALVNGQQATRTATVIAREPTKLLKVTQVSFEQHIRSERENELADHVRFMREVPLFRNIEKSRSGDAVLSDIGRLLMNKTFVRGQVVMRQGEANDQFFFLVVKSGGLRVIREVDFRKVMQADELGFTEGSSMLCNGSLLVPRPPPGEDILEQGKLSLVQSTHKMWNKQEPPAFVPLEVDILRRGAHITRRLPIEGSSSVGQRLSACVSLVATQETTVLYLNKWDFMKRMADLQRYGINKLLQQCAAEMLEYENDQRLLEEWARGASWEDYKVRVMNSTLETLGRPVPRGVQVPPLELALAGEHLPQRVIPARRGPKLSSQFRSQRRASQELPTRLRLPKLPGATPREEPRRRGRRAKGYRHTDPGEYGGDEYGGRRGSQASGAQTERAAPPPDPVFEEIKRKTRERLERIQSARVRLARQRYNI